MAEELDMPDWIVEIFDDPDFEQKLLIMAEMGPQDPGKAQVISPAGVQQQRGFPGKQKVETPRQLNNAANQERAGIAQTANQGVY